MAIPTIIKKVWKDDKSFVLTSYFAWSAGAADNLSDTIVLDISSDIGAFINVQIDRIDVNMTVLTSALFEIDATTDTHLLYVTNLAGTAVDVKREFDKNTYPALKIRPQSAAESGLTGDIVCTTTGAGATANMSVVISGYYD